MQEWILSRIADRIVRGPFGKMLDFNLDHVEPDLARVRLRFHEGVLNGGGIVHGGAIASLLDTAATAAAWASPDLNRGARGATASLTINYLNAGLESDVLATARVIRRGRSLCSIEVDVNANDGRHIARGLVTYRLQNSDVDDATGEGVSLAKGAPSKA
ncbi:MAG: PaaI family thioesterase [Gammaproteobacteria bacterium]|nr:PaaI family thioesterase [Gammaproteobacteria bacterium]